MKMKNSGGGLAFDGVDGQGYSRNGTKMMTNQWSGHSNDGRLVNVGRGPTKGNQDYNGMQGRHREAPTDAMPAVKPGKDMFMGSSHPQMRTPGGTRSFEPKMGQNYRGNCDSMNVGRGPTKGNQQ